MYFAPAGEPTAPCGCTARVGTTSTAICADDVAATPSLAACLLIALSCDSEEVTAAQVVVTAQSDSVSAACHIDWHPALIELIAPSLDMSLVDMSPACMQQLEAEPSMLQTWWEQDAFARAGCVTSSEATTKATI